MIKGGGRPLALYCKTEEGFFPSTHVLVSPIKKEFPNLITLVLEYSNQKSYKKNPI